MRPRIGFAGLVPLVLVAVLVVVAVGYGMGSKTWGGAGSDPAMATLTYRIAPLDGQPPVSTGLDVTVSILKERLTSVDVAGFSVTAEPPDTVVVKVPAVVDLPWLQRIIGRTGRIDFVLLPPADYGTADTAGPRAVPARGESIDPVLPAQFTGADLDTTKTQAVSDTMNPDFWKVLFGFSDAKAREFEIWSGAHVNEYFAIVVDGKVQSAPYIQSAITGGLGEINGNYTETVAEELAAVLKGGQLPYPLVLQSVQRPGESLASSSPSAIASPAPNASPSASLLPAASGSPAASPWLTPDASAFGPAEIASPTASS
jgi:preprotein translocase subunit SecD